MNALAVLVILIDTLVLFAVPRRWAGVPILAIAFYLPVAAGFDIGPFNFYGLRLVLTFGFLRMLLRQEGPSGGMNRLDALILVWSLIALTSSLFYDDILATFINRAGMVFMACGSYFALRAFCTSTEDVVRLCRAVAWLLVPVAIAMFYEKMTGLNPFSEFGGVAVESEIRNGTIRAQGAFSHSILAGSAGAACLPLMAALWRTHRSYAVTGILSCLIMIFASGSTGPIMGAMFGIGALCWWRLRQHTWLLRWSIVGAYCALELVMNAPAYYIMAYIDLTGSSTSWHRAALIESTLTHFSEWWIAGTSYTRHWMAYGVGWSGNHIDITNYYIRMGIDGGLPLMLLFIAVLSTAFSLVGKTLQKSAANVVRAYSFLPWALGASLVTHAANFMSVSYFDQTVVLLYATLATIGSTWNSIDQPVTATTEECYFETARTGVSA